MYIKGFDFYVHKLNYGTYTGQYSVQLPSNLELLDAQNNIITEKSFKGKVIVLDFWHTRCGVCFAKFPALQDLYNTFRSNPNVLIYAVNKKLDGDNPSTAFNKMEELNYTFPVLVLKNEDLLQQLAIEYYPMVLLVDKTGKVIYKGEVDGIRQLINSAL